MNQSKPIIQSGNKVIDDFIKHTLTRKEGRMEYVPYSEFKNVNFIAEGGFSKIYKAIWINGPRYDSKQCKSEMTVALKELANSKNITSKHLNELKIFNDFVLSYIRDDDWLQSITGDLGLSKSSLVEEEDDEIYVCHELRPPIDTNAPKGYIDLMQKCWHFDPSERPSAVELQKNIENISVKEPCSKTKIMRSSDIGPMTTNNLHKNSLLSEMIKSAESIMSLLDYSTKSPKSHKSDIINFRKSNNDGYVL
ncbi:unnamed protein product [Rhizophagus irregularis]|nr:unnamed protein product [Rhizophagus irregularis]